MHIWYVETLIMCLRGTAIFSETAKGEPTGYVDDVTIDEVPEVLNDVEVGVIKFDTLRIED